MPAIVRPERAFSFADHARNHPREGIPADRLDVQINNLIDAIHSTQQALADIRRDDGQLKNHSVGPEQLAVELRHTRGEIDSAEKRTLANAASSLAAASHITTLMRDVELRARDAENAAMSGAEFLSAVNTARQIVERRSDIVINATDIVEAQTSDAENWANWSQAQATNAKTDQEMAAAWAEYLAGPVVDSAAAPAYISGTPWGHGLYYQPVEGYGGNAGLWSAKWWAVYAAQLVGPWGFYYFGGWPSAPLPGSTNPSTGVKVPDPIAPGSFYYNTTTHQLYIWDGGQWTTPYSLSPAYQNNFVYVATAGQKVFTGPDSGGKVPNVGNSPSDVHLNGVRLVPVSDYTISGNTLTLLVGASINSIVQWDLLVATTQLTPGAVNIFKVALTPAPNGVATAFTMTYSNPTTGTQPVNATSNAQMIISIDGIVQEPGTDFTASGPNITFATPPVTGARFWGIWIANSVITS